MRHRPATADRPARRRCTAALLVLLLAACADPTLQAPAAAPSVSPAVGAASPDPRLALLRAELDALRRTVVAARDATQRAATAETLPAARAAAEEAVHALTADPELAGDLDGDGTVADPGVAPLLPGPADRLEELDYGDALTATLTAARDAGTAGGPVVDVLRDPVAGDLGVWSQDPAAVLAQVRAVAAATSLERAEALAEGLDGEATLALAWAALAARATRPELVRGAAERAVAHLDVVLEALDTLTVG